MKKIIIFLAILSLSFVWRFGGDFLNAQNIEWSYYNGDGSDLFGLGSGTGTEYGVAVFIPGNGMLKGGKITGIKIPVNNGSKIGSMKAWITIEDIPSPTMKFVREKVVDKSNMPKGQEVDMNDIYATVSFDSDFDIPASGCYLGYSFTIASGKSEPYPMMIDFFSKNDHGFYYFVNGLKSWEVTGTEDGVSGLKALISGVDYVDADVTIAPFNSQITTTGQKLTVSTMVNSNSKSAVSSIEYRIKSGNKEETRTADISIKKGTGRQKKLDISVPVPSEAGEYAVEMTVLKVNGEANSSASDVSSTLCRNVSHKVQRNTLVEEYTGTRCPWCPRGIVGMDMMKKKYGDRFVGIAIHQYTPNSSQDAMYQSRYRNHGMTSAPNALIDNKELVDPYLGSGKYKNVIGDFDKYNAVPALVDIDLKAWWTDEQKNKVRVNAEVEGLCTGEYTIAYVITADSLHGTESAWAQVNELSKYTASELGGTDLAPFCKGGIYGQSPVYPYFNDVLICSSYDESKTNHAESLGTLIAGTPVKSSYILSLPSAPESLCSQIAENIDKIYAVAIVWDKYNQVAQAKKINVNEIIPVGINSVNSQQSTVNGNIFDLLGRKVNADYRGIVIRNGKKVIVK